MALVYFQVDDAVGGSTCTKRALHTECSRRVVYPGTTVDVVGTDDRTNEFLHQIILFIRTTGRRDTGDAVGSVFFFDGGQLLQRSQRLLPQVVSSSPFLRMNGCADTILMVVETEGIASFRQVCPPFTSASWVPWILLIFSVNVDTSRLRSQTPQ